MKYLLIFVVLIMSLPYWLGLYDIYLTIRFVKDNQNVDKTAGALHWQMLKWFAVTQGDRLAKVWPFIGKDAGEIYGVREDDGRIS